MASRITRPASDSDPQSSETEGLVPHSDDQKLRPGEEKLGQMARFGPTYGKDTESNHRAKTLAWERIMEEASAENEIETSYIRLIKEIEKKVIECYDDGMLKRGLMFQKMMVRDGCFFLQLALHILGAGDLLGYPDPDPYFGKNVDCTYWIPDMFFPGNQIPYVVIDVLMKQPFFMKVIQRGNWHRPSEDDLVRLALYQTVVEPHLATKVARHNWNPPSDILTALHNLLLGFEDNPDTIYDEMMEFQDLETGSEESTDKIPSAGKLCALGIKIVKGKAGIRNIRFRNYGYSARLYLPPLIFDGHTDQLLTSLANYEERHFNKSQREVTAYFRFMRDLIPTYKDFKILERNGVIIVKGEGLRAAFSHSLRDIVSLHNPTYTAKFSDMRRKITEYEVVPWRFMSLVCSIACGIITFIIAVLTTVQTVVTVLSYIHDRRA